jgi:hypothetical protein
MQKVENIVKSIQNKEYSKSELFKLLKNQSMLVQVNAVIQLCQDLDAETLTELKKFIKNEKNQQRRFLDNSSISYIAISELLKSGDKIARQVVKTIIFEWNDTRDKKYLLDFLQAQ